MELVSESIKGRLLFAIPKKGRLYEQCLELLAGADIQFTRSHRLDVALARNHPIALVFLPAADIPRFVGEGNVDLGITGQDMVAESDTPQHLINEVLSLGFGKCKLQIQVPERGPIKTLDDLVGKKVVTSFDRLSADFFKKLDQQAGNDKKTLIEYVGGSVEAACALGLADGIVDLVESGDTMRAAGLHAIHTLMTSEAVLIRSPRPCSNPELETVMKRVISRMQGVLAANRFVICQYNIQRHHLDAATSVTPGRRAATVSPLEDERWVAVSAMVAKKESADVMDKLQAIGASDIFLLSLTNCRV